MSQTLYEKALIFATRKHSGQARKVFPVPYICHPVHVSSILYEMGCHDENILSAALLHDTLEDTQTTYEELVKEFNPLVADLVKELTNTAEAKQDKVAYTEKRFNEMSYEACLVKSADILCNLNDTIKSRSEDKANTKDYLEKLGIICTRARIAMLAITDLCAKPIYSKNKCSIFTKTQLKETNNWLTTALKDISQRLSQKVQQYQDML